MATQSPPVRSWGHSITCHPIAQKCLVPWFDKVNLSCSHGLGCLSSAPKPSSCSLGAADDLGICLCTAVLLQPCLHPHTLLLVPFYVSVSFSQKRQSLCDLSLSGWFPRGLHFQIRSHHRIWVDTNGWEGVLPCPLPSWSLI